jgi:hypothetical protein
MNDFEPNRLRSAMIRGMAEGMTGLVRRQGAIDENEVQSGLRGEELVRRGGEHAATHSSGARAARKAQQQ